MITWGDKMEAFVVSIIHLGKDGKTTEEQIVCENMINVARILVVAKPKRGCQIVEYNVRPHYSLF